MPDIPRFVTEEQISRRRELVNKGLTKEEAEAAIIKTDEEDDLKEQRRLYGGPEELQQEALKRKKEKSHLPPLDKEPYVGSKPPPEENGDIL